MKLDDKKDIEAILKLLQKENIKPEELESYLDKIKSENKWLKDEVRQRFSLAEHQTISFMLGKTIVDTFSRKLSPKDIAVRALNIYAESIKRKKKINNNLLKKLVVFVSEEYQDSSSFVIDRPSSVVNSKAIIEEKKAKAIDQVLKVSSTVSKIYLKENSERQQPIENLKNIRVSAIMDGFTYESYSPEFQIDQLSINYWHEQLTAFKPDILFIESAWRGLNDEWDRKISNISEELENIISWCKERKIPTVFWNKEDPIHFETFINTARNFDFVFTTDVDCIDRYKTALDHNNVYWLPFAAQLLTHNPIEKYNREDAFCFAGAYYVKYPERTKDLNNFIEQFSKVKPFIIYDRNFGKNDSDYKFPMKFDFFIRGNLPYDKIDKAYKGYNYIINLNSIKQSQSMFARRVYEVLASNSLLVSNYSRGVRLIFGDLIACSDSPSIILDKLSPLMHKVSEADYIKLLSLRKILAEHTYTHRSLYLAEKVLGLNLKEVKKIAVIAIIRNNEDYTYVLKNYNRQKNVDSILVTLDISQIIDDTIEHFNCYSIDELIKIIENSETDWVSYFSFSDYYGEYYLYDLILTLGYSQAKFIGKSEYYSSDKLDDIVLKGSDKYRLNTLIYLRNSLVETQELLRLLGTYTLENIYDLEKITFNQDTISIDYFNYCMNFNYHSNNELLLEDNNFVNTGYSIEDFNRITKFKSEHTIKNRMKNISALYLYKQFNQPVNKYFDITYSNNCIVINSNLKNDQHDYYYAKSAIPLKELGLKSNTSQDVYLDTDVGLNIQLIFKYLDSNLVNISHSMILATKNQKIDIPSNCQYVLIGIRIYGHGQTKVNYLMLGHKIIDPTFVISNKSCLLVTNHYPSYSDLYRNAFVHSRVVAYQDQGLIVDVFRLRVNESVTYHEFEGVDVVTGSNDALEKMIENNNFKVIMVHFLDESMWSSLSKYTDTHKVIVWVHGAEIQAWHRRAFNHSNQREIDKAKSLYEKRAKFWSKILKNIPKNLHLIFVSKYFADEVMNDLQLEIPENQYSIIPNPIDTNMFSNVSKDVELRKKILTIRPFASKTYANDLTVKIIMELIKEPFFSELEFRIVGDGPLFEETIEPLVSLQLDNIIIERKFLTHNEIAMLHKEYGIFLCPSRMDTQGVSRDEAMASGLVPITNAVGAIPEFLKEFEELTLPPEDYIAMAEKIKDLYYNPDKFGFLSKRVSASIKSRSSGKIIIKEIEIIKR